MQNNAFNELCVLVVDDNQFARKLLVAVLRAVGVRKIREAEDGAEALQHFGGTPIDLVFTDVTMPVVDGIELIRMLSAPDTSPNPYVPIIVISAYCHVDTITQCRNAGATEFVAKPITAAAVIRRLQVVIENPRPFIQAGRYFGPDRRRRSIETLPAERRVG